MNRRNFLKTIGALGIGAGLGFSGFGRNTAARAADAAPAYPTRPIRHYVYQSAGGAVDATTRKVVEFVSARLGQPIAVEQKVGAMGRIALGELYRAKPDGYHLLTGTGYPEVIGEMVFNGQYKFREIVPIFNWGKNDWYIVVNNKISPYTTFKELYDACQKERLTGGDMGLGGATHFQMLAIQDELKMPFTAVHFDGTAPMQLNLIGGHIDFCIVSAPNAMANPDDLRVLATTAKVRTPLLPDVSTLKELGFDCTDNGSLYVCLAPPKLPAEIQQILEKAYRDTMADPAYQEWAMNYGVPVSPMTSDEIRATYESYAAMVERYAHLFK